MALPGAAAEFLREHEAAWVTLPNSLYDPEKGAALYARYIDELVYAEEIGLDGVVVNEHHQKRLRIDAYLNLIVVRCSPSAPRG